VSTRDRSSAHGEEELFEDSLRAHGQLADDQSDEKTPDATHHVEVDDRGERSVRRDRFSAI
jgi:hypothetical protein